ncbi:hypothetical protein RhiirC2_785883 [Rhizophagus irregularis]|uniref:Protein kinase domain-containing protein n=1 Tax=Rhizophagus irregularis TaxID=588596 RepID=A0A2N1MVH6_9GLOM|nr:hypothetical protein RhiirC2_785883 [Rhizophagus irregularis]
MYNNIEYFHNIQKIGSSTFGKVYRANWKSSEQYSIKIFFNLNNIAVKEIFYELKLQREIQFHDNIIKFYGITKFDSDGLYEGDSNEPVNNCFTVLPNSLKKSFVHILTVQETKECGVKYYKIVPADVESCPYIIIISKELIYQANTDTIDITPTRIVTDRLRYFVNKIQKEINPQGYRLLGVVYNYSHSNIDNFCDYVKRLYLSFKHVAGEHNNYCISKIFQSIFDLVLELTVSPIQFKHIHETGWSCIIADLDFAQAKGLGLALNKIDSTKDWKEHLIHILKSYQKIQEKRYGEAVVDEMNALLIAKSENEIDLLFDKI